MRPTILLFDIDGTLITTGGVGRRAFVRSVTLLYGKHEACSTFSFAGMTDRAIARQALTNSGIDPNDANIAKTLAQYLTFLSEELQRSDRAKYQVHLGMPEAVQAGLAAEMAVGLGTGNVRDGAMAKLHHVGLAEHFRFGGFGDDHEHRPELLRVAASRGAAQLGVPVEDARVVVIGDTPKDVHAAQAIGAESVGVGTGDFTPSQLLEAGATCAFDTIASPGALDALLHGGK